jgi:hypothetical protein
MKGEPERSGGLFCMKEPGIARGPPEILMIR